MVKIIKMRTDISNVENETESLKKGLVSLDIKNQELLEENNNWFLMSKII